MDLLSEAPPLTWIISKGSYLCTSHWKIPNWRFPPESDLLSLAQVCTAVSFSFSQKGKLLDITRQLGTAPSSHRAFPWKEKENGPELRCDTRRHLKLRNPSGYCFELNHAWQAFLRYFAIILPTVAGSIASPSQTNGTFFSPNAFMALKTSFDSPRHGIERAKLAMDYNVPTKRDRPGFEKENF